MTEEAPCAKCGLTAFHMQLCLFHYREWRKEKNEALNGSQPTAER